MLPHTQSARPVGRAVRSVHGGRRLPHPLSVAFFRVYDAPYAVTVTSAAIFGWMRQ
jgi:hypothetical protein